MKRIRRRIHEMTDRRQYGVKDVRVIIRTLNPVLIGSSGYFRTENARLPSGEFACSRGNADSEYTRLPG